MKKKIRPIVIDEIVSEKVNQKFDEKAIIRVFPEKKETNGVPVGHVRVIILRECPGMSGVYKQGDIIDLPDRRFKTLALRGFCAEYKGSKKPNKVR